MTRRLLVLPLLLELYVYTLGLGLILATLFVRFRDIGQIWELVAQILFFAAGIMYPIGILPPRAEQISFLNPLIQIIQDIRHSLALPEPWRSRPLAVRSRMMPAALAGSSSRETTRSSSSWTS